MTLARSIAANYAAQLYASILGIAVVPLYLGYMGAEAYGLVGFFVMAQSWSQLLDLGLTPTVARESARYRGGALDALNFRRLFRVMEAVFVLIALLVGAGLALSSDSIAGRWLNVELLPTDQVRRSIELMGGIISLRWVAGLYRGAVGGFEEQVWLAKLNVAMATARFVGVFLVLEWLGTTPLHFFVYQFIVALIETIALVWKGYALLPSLGKQQLGRWSLAPLRGVLGFSASVAFTGAVWTVVTQLDKLLLSRLLPLSSYAYFTLAVVVAGGVSLMTGPVSTALLPRMSRLSAAGDERTLLELYGKATQLVTAIVAPIAVMLAIFPVELIAVWTGDAFAAAEAGPILRLYAIGNGILAVAAFPYYLQFAKGKLRLHIIGNVLFVLLLVPAIVFATNRYGAMGAGWAWLGANLFYFVGWIPVVHRRFAPNLHGTWLARDVGPIAMVAVVSALGFSRAVPFPAGRGAGIAALVVIGLCVAALCVFASPFLRSALRDRLQKVD